MKHILIVLTAVLVSAGLMATAAFGGFSGSNGERDTTNDTGNPEAPANNGNDSNNPDRPVNNVDNPGFVPDEDDKINDPDGDRKVVAAPIDEIEIQVMESFPPQYAVRIVSGLPSGCAAFHELTTARDGNTITITVTNTVPASDEVICTMIYGMKEHNVNLGSDFVSGETYTVTVNGESETFIAQ